jgi:hypothetical protein
MSDAELDRVRADLAIMKSACVEPAIPAEEFRVGLIIGCFGVMIAVAPWVVPINWVRWGAAVVVLIGAAIYIPWKRRIIKNDAPRRRMEVQEIRIWTIVCIGLVAYLLLHRFGLPPVRGYSNACFFAVGLGLVANGLIHPTRRPSIVAGIPVMIAGVLLSLSRRVEVSLSISGACLAVVGFGCSATLAWLTRRERRQHVGH